MTEIKKYYLIVQILTLLLFIIATFSGYFIITSTNTLNFGINWNMFNSILIVPLFIIGLLVSFNQKFQVYEAVVIYKDKDGKERSEPSGDIIDYMFAGCLLPLLQYLIIGPLMIAAAIYYPLMCVVYVFSAIFPYLIIVFFIISLIFAYQAMKRAIFAKKRTFFILLISISFTAIYWICYISWDTEYARQMHIVASIGIVFALLVYFVMSHFIKTIDGDENEIGGEISKTICKFFGVSVIIVLSVYSYKFLNSTSYNYSTDTSQPSYTIYRVNTESALNVRSGPDSSYEKIGSLNSGDLVKVYSTSGGWAKINYNQKHGYVSQQFLTQNTQVNNKTIKTIAEEKATIPVEDVESTETKEAIDIKKTPPAKEKVEFVAPTISPSSPSIKILRMKGNITSINENYDRYYSSKRMSNNDVQKMQLHKINSGFQADDLIKGKTIYSGNEGKIESFIFVIPDQNTEEYLVSYDKSGNYISHIQIGELGVFSGARSYGQIENNKITVFSYDPATESNKQKIFTVDSNLKFSR